MYKITIAFALVAVILAVTLLLIFAQTQSNESFILEYDVFKSAHNLGSNKYTPPEEKNSEFWFSRGHEDLFKNLAKQHLNRNKVKNIIFFMGDGMGVSTLTAARILKGQRRNRTGEEESLCLDNFPYTGLSKTYCLNSQVADSSCSATAYLGGVKGNIVTIGVNGNVDFNNCTASRDPNNQVSSIAVWAQKAGKSTGFITTTTLTHASPAGIYGHTPHRLHECDADVVRTNKDPNECLDLAQQLVTQETGQKLNVLMGGGMGKFIPNTQKDGHGKFGERLDGKNLISMWQQQHPQGVVLTNRDQLLGVNTSQVSHIMGVFGSGSMQFNALADKQKQPSLSEMTEVALKLLQGNSKGYFLFIEGGLIDVAHHETMAGLAIDETLEMDKAVQLASDMTNPLDTLIIVTADHSQPLTISGYPNRGNPILGINQDDIALDNLKYSTINYPLGFQQYLDTKGKRLNLEELTWKIDSRYPSYVNTFKGPHAGEDVSIYASGPFAHLFTGVMEQSSIPIIAAYAACIGDGPKFCDGL
ncbi:membrane-bound alkaline phosphatase-like [Haematobia irritans]|uniref:membrane-bound alkaline phosphatase-like n=1 Tax=Haematobia irritans TaxID=7368 RepID=UPI003F4F4F6D